MGKSEQNISSGKSARKLYYKAIFEIHNQAGGKTVDLSGAEMSVGHRFEFLLCMFVSIVFGRECDLSSQRPRQRDEDSACRFLLRRTL